MKVILQVWITVNGTYWQSSCFDSGIYFLPYLRSGTEENLNGKEYSCDLSADGRIRLNGP